MSTARWMMLAAAVLFSTGGTAIKLSEFGGWQVAGLRSAVAAVVLYAALPDARRGWTREVWMVSVAYAATLALFVVANKLTTAANAIFLQSTSPLYILALSPFLLGERFRQRDLGVLGLIAIGLVLFVTAAEETTAIATNPALGNALACGAGATWGCTIMGLRWLSSRGEPGAAAASTVLGNLLVAVFILPLGWPYGGGTVVDWLVMLYLGVIQIGLAYVFMTRAMAALPALTASLILMVEPVASAVFAAGVHAEIPAPRAVLGGALILGALLLQSWLDRDASVDDLE